MRKYYNKEVDVFMKITLKDGQKNKYKELCKKHNRSMTNMTTLLIDNFIEKDRGKLIEP